MYKEKLKEIFSHNEIVTAKQIRDADIPTVYVSMMVEQGEIQRISRGIYASSNISFSEQSDYILAALQVPRGVISLASALRFHALTDENPAEITMSIEKGKWCPHIAYPPINFNFRNKDSFSSGVEIHIIQGIEVKVYSIEKTIADCFKFRNKIGLDIASSSIRVASVQNRIDYNKLWQFAKICRVTKIIQPYLEAIK